METYLFFDGNCAEAMRFYERTLGGKIEMMMTHAESPEAARSPPGNANRILHASLVVGGQRLMPSDAMAGQPYEGMKGFCLSLVFPTVDEAKRLFEALAQGGRVNMPMDKTFFVEAFGMLVDRFGTPWMVSGGQQNK